MPLAERLVHRTKELDHLGDTLWRGPALTVAETTLISDIASVPFVLEPRNLPFNGDVSLTAIRQLQVHIRSRYAHVGLDVLFDTGDQLVSTLLRRGGVPRRKPTEVYFVLVNHCATPVELRAGSQPFHFFYIPEAAYIKGGELKGIVIGLNGEERDMSGKKVIIKGHQGVHWNWYEESTGRGERVVNGIYMRIDPNDRYWIPKSNIPIRLSETGTFQEARDYLFTNHFKSATDAEFPLPKNGLWVGKLPYLTLISDVYAVLDPDAFYDVRGREFHKVGLQTHSPLLEGKRTNHYPHVEIKGPADWARVRIVRNGQEAKAG